MNSKLPQFMQQIFVCPLKGHELCLVVVPSSALTGQLMVVHQLLKCLSIIVVAHYDFLTAHVASPNDDGGALFAFVPSVFFFLFSGSSACNIIHL